MKAISKKDLELVRTLTLLSKFEKSNQKLAKQLEEKFTSNGKDDTAAFAYAVYNLLNLKKLYTDGDIAIQNLKLILNALNTVLDNSPDYWLARFFRCLLTLFIPESIVEEETLLEDLKTLIEQQEQVSEKPYFLVPYVMLADYYYLYETRELALQTLNQGFENVACQEIKVLDDFLYIPVKDALARMVQSGEQEIAGILKEKARIMFPKEEFFQ